MSHSITQCYDLLAKTGRAFEMTIRYLVEELRDALCLYYLVQRAVDTVEDDMTIPNDVKVTMLASFDKYLLDPAWKYTESNDEYAVVLENFPQITQALPGIPTKYRDIILELGSLVGQNMTKFVGKEFITMEDMNEYCTHVTAVNCAGILRLFEASGLEAEIQDASLFVQSSVMIQKTNIIRDFSKDWKGGRLYYPRDVWNKYVNNADDFLKPVNFDKGVQCVNELVTDALQHAVPSLQFLSELRSPSAMKFFGIHQVMSIATLERCYGNPRVFTESVKIGREETAAIIQTSSSFREIADKVRHYTQRVMERALRTNGTVAVTLEICRQILHQIELLTRDKQL